MTRKPRTIVLRIAIDEETQDAFRAYYGLGKRAKIRSGIITHLEGVIEAAVGDVLQEYRERDQ